MKKIIALILSLLMLLSFAGCKGGSSEGASADGPIAGVDYYHYETEDFNKDCDRLEKLAQTDRTEKMLKLYDRLYEQCVEMESLYSVIYVKYSTDVNDEYFSEEQLYSYEILQESEDRLCGICRKITEGPSADAFREHVGDEAFMLFADYTVLSKRQKQIMKREKKLVDEYNKTMDKVYKHVYKYDGKEWTIDNFFGDEGNALAQRDYYGYLEIYDALMKHANGQTGKIFLELVDLRTELAESFGYDNYADFADVEEYNRDYSSEDLDRLYEDVQDISGKFYDSYYGSDGEEPEIPELSTKKMLDYLQKYSEKISRLSGSSCDRMLEKNLYSIGDESCRQDGAFTTYIPKTGSPFISMTLDEQRDFAVLTHEFGHFVQYGKSSADNILLASDNLDLAEIASNGFEGLMTNYYDEIFGKGNTASQYVAQELLFNVIDGCVYDQFQREVYENPDMSLSEINKCYGKIYGQYNTWAGEDEGYSWVFVNHNFEAPMYYISYATSALAALQIWNMSQNDFDEAVAVWETFIKEGTYNKQYFEVLDKTELMRFTDEGAVKTICKPALKAVQ